MSAIVIYKRTRKLYSSFVRQFFWRGVAIYLMLQTVVVAVVCWICALMILQLSRFFSANGVADIWYHLFVTLPIALLPAPGLIRLVRLVFKFKHDYTRMYESCPYHRDEEIDAEIKIDNDGIDLGKKKEEWKEMTLGFATKDFYVFLTKSHAIIGIPKYAVDVKLGKYLMNKMQNIKERWRR